MCPFFSAPEVAQVVGQHPELESHLVRSEPGARQQRLAGAISSGECDERLAGSVTLETPICLDESIPHAAAAEDMLALGAGRT